MGTKSSKTEKEDITPNKNDEPKINQNNIDELFSTTNNTQVEVGTSKNSKNIIEEKKYPYKFEYKGEGMSVLLAGDFLENWKGIKVMIKNPKTGIFERVVYLPKGKYQFKFIVDNKWICSNQYPTIPDERGIINNYIDLTNYSPPENLLKDELRKKLGTKNINKNNKEISFNNGFSTNLPEYDELNTIAPSINALYIKTFDLNYKSNQNICNNYKLEYLKFKERNNMNENSTYKKILTCPHELLMHLCPEINDYSIQNTKNNNYIKIATSMRIKHKFLTIEYYTPRK